MTAEPLTATLLATGPFRRERAPFELLRVRGPDAGGFLQRLCTQDVQGLGEGQLAPVAFLDAKGKVQATGWSFRRDDTFWIETHSEQIERLEAMLERYHFTEQLTVAREDAGPCHERVAAPDGIEPGVLVADDGFQLRVVRRGVAFVRSYGGVTRLDAAPLADELAEALRMCAGLVRVGIETEASTLALEADLDDHCSTRKGCYTGQEIVARIHTYGHVNRKLCLLRLAPGDAITAPVPLLEPEDEIAVGRVMHAVAVTGHELRVGLGYLPKDFQAIGTKLLLEGGGDVEVVGFGEVGDA